MPTADLLKPSTQARVLRTDDEVESVRPAWVALEGESLHADIDWFQAISRAHPDVLRPHVVAVEEDGAIRTIVAAHLMRQCVPHRIGHFVPFAPTITSVHVSYQGLLGDQAPELLELAFDELVRASDNGEADAVLLRYVREGSPLVRIAEEAVKGPRRERFLRPTIRWAVDLDETLNGTLAAHSAKVRENARRTVRRVERELRRAVVRVLERPEDAEALFRDVDAVATRSYQRRGGHLFPPGGLERSLALVGLERGWYRAYVLDVNGVPVAYWTGYDYGGVFGWRGSTGFDPTFARYSPGTYLLLRMVDDLCERGARVFDIGRGDLPYKRQLGTRFWQETDFRIFAARPGTTAIALTGSTVNGMHRLLLLGAGLIDRDGGLRRRLSRQTASQRLAGP